jgi:aryl-alcohol dehydrogenase-like predicted oxidoreductase
VHSSRWRNLAMSRMMLGTVQFGLPYGIANRTGQPQPAEVVRIVGAAVEGGVTCFDTAAAYGTSEEVLGRALQELKLSSSVTVVTKVRPISDEAFGDPAAARREIAKSIEQSRKKLQLDCLPVVLFHREQDAAYLEMLFELRDRGWLAQVGVSCDNQPGRAVQFSQSQQVDALQIPASLVDRRHALAGSFDSADCHGVAVFVRSVFLQGLLLLPDANIAESLRPVIPVRAALTSLAFDSGMSLRELAVRFVLTLPGVTSVITGVETVDQVRDNLHLFAAGPLSPELWQAVMHLDVLLPEKIITPSRWM